MTNTLENLDELSPEELKEKLVEKDDAYKQLQSSTTKGVSNLNEAIKFYKSSAGDVSKLKELNTTNPDIAKIVLEKFFDGKPIEELVQSTTTNSEINIDEKVKEAIELQKVSDMVQSTMAQLPEDLKDKFKQEFDDIVEGKKMTSANVSKYITAAIKLISPSIDKSVESLAHLNSIGNVVGGKTEKKQDNSFADTIKQQSRDLLKSQGVL